MIKSSPEMGNEHFSPSKKMADESGCRMIDRWFKLLIHSGSPAPFPLISFYPQDLSTSFLKTMTEAEPCFNACLL